MMTHSVINSPLVSISCITFNHAPYIKEALDSFLMQETDFPFEILIHDDCSTDGTDKIIREYAKRYPEIIKPLYETENQYSQGKPIGSIVWNIPRAKGKYIAFCEGDDYWCDPKKLQKQVNFLEVNHDYGLIYSKVKEFDSITNKFQGSSGGPYEAFDDLIIANTIPTPTTLFRKNLIDLYIKEDWMSKGYLMSDYPIWLFISVHSKIKFVNQVTAVYRIVSGSASHPKSLRKWIMFQESYTKIKFDFADAYIPNCNQIKKSISHTHVKSILRWRTLFDKELKNYAHEIINRFEYHPLKKLIFKALNRSRCLNYFLKVYLLNKKPSIKD